MPKPGPVEIYLARHGETAWSLSGQHTGRTDIPLTDAGEAAARALGQRLAGLQFDHVLTSPLQRAARTADLAGFEGRAQPEPDLVEWDYGRYEGLKTDAIQEQVPDWTIFRDGAPGGESVADVGARADRVIARARGLGGRVILFGHGHFTRVLAARWLGLPPGGGRFFLCGTAALGILQHDHDATEPAIGLWNDTGHVKG